MRRGAFAIAWLVVSASTTLGAGDLPQPGPPAVLHLAWMDVTRLGVGADQIIRAEARSILEEAGIEVVWRVAEAGEEARPGEVRVVFVDRALADRTTRRPILGLTPVRPGEPPLVWIHVGSVRVVLRLPVRRASHALSVGQRRDLSVALGRVVAHEVVHSLLPAEGHGPGLMSGALTRFQLTRARVPLGATLGRSLRAALREGPGRGGGYGAAGIPAE